MSLTIAVQMDPIQRIRIAGVLARRYAASGGEIDLIVKRGDTIAFVEVKARGVMDNALVAIGP